MMNQERPLIAISSGDPAGIGPEITLKALKKASTLEKCKPLVIGSMKIFSQINDILDFGFELNAIQNPEDGLYKNGTIDIYDIDNIDMSLFQFNKISKMCGQASFEYILKAIDLANKGKVEATVTGPIHKESIQLAGHDYAGHTEIFASYTQTKNYSMMLAEGDFRVVHVSTHVSLLDAIKNVKTDRVLKVIQLAHETLKRMGISKPIIAVAGLNPHAGEHGLFGREEIDEIIPAIEMAKKQQINASGPYPPDTIFPLMKGGKYDLVVCMYHDQGHIPTKLLGFNFNSENNTWDNMSGVNITLGLPIIRVSVDHGVAFDKGGKGEANPESMIQALNYAGKFSLGKRVER